MYKINMECPNCCTEMLFENNESVCKRCGTEIKGNLDVTIKYLHMQKKRIVLSIGELSDINFRLADWRADRNISIHTQESTMVNNINEELDELYNNGLDENFKIKDEYEFIDALSDMVVIILNSTMRTTKIKDKEYLTSQIFALMFEECDSMRAPNPGLKEDTSYVFKNDYLRKYWKEITKEGNPKIEDIYEFFKMIIYTMYRYRYNPYKVLNETIYEISDRTQDPIQKERWEDMRNKGIPIEEKWEKDKDPEVQKTWYKANYFKALR